MGISINPFDYKEKQIGMAAARKPSEGVLSHSKGG